MSEAVTLSKFITFFGQRAKVACDAKCNKAWGLNSRPKDAETEIFMADQELGEAPADPGTYEGGDAKPVAPEQRLNRWCVRECERCAMSAPGEYDKPLTLKDFSNRGSP